LCELDACVEFIDAALARNTGILVYCTAGMSRSATVVISYVMKSRLCTVDDALAIVKRSRRWVKPNPGFMDQLRVRLCVIAPGVPFELPLLCGFRRRFMINCGMVAPDWRRVSCACDGTFGVPLVASFPPLDSRRFRRPITEQFVTDDPHFVILLCDSCDCPMVPYTGVAQLFLSAHGVTCSGDSDRRFCVRMIARVQMRARDRG
jgi:hypothetical protein